MSIEDSLVLSTLLGQAGSVDDALVALKVYDQMRRPRTQRIVESSRETGLMLSGKHEQTGLDKHKLKKHLQGRWNTIVDFDMKQHRDAAVQVMRLELQRNSI